MCRIIKLHTLSVILECRNFLLHFFPRTHSSMGSFRVLVSSILYFIGTFLLIPSCILFLPFGNYIAAVLILTSACSYLTLAALVDFVYVFFIEHCSAKQMLSSLFMLVGGILFLTASVLYYPQGDVDGIDCVILGTWVFRIGSVCYLSGSVTSLLELYHGTSKANTLDVNGNAGDYNYNPIDYERGMIHSLDSGPSPSQRASVRARWLAVVYNYIIGALLYILGGIFSQYLSMSLPGVITWIAGSLFFVCGAFVQLYHVATSWNN